MGKDIYIAPDLEVQILSTDGLMTVSGGGGGVVLPDDNWNT